MGVRAVSRLVLVALVLASATHVRDAREGSAGAGTLGSWKTTTNPRG